LPSSSHISEDLSRLVDPGLRPTMARSIDACNDKIAAVRLIGREHKNRPVMMRIVGA
jgi:hypothetical protein